MGLLDVDTQPHNNNSDDGDDGDDGDDNDDEETAATTQQEVCAALISA